MKTLTFIISIRSQIVFQFLLLILNRTGILDWTGQFVLLDPAEAIHPKSDPSAFQWSNSSGHVFDF